MESNLGRREFVKTLGTAGAVIATTGWEALAWQARTAPGPDAAERALVLLRSMR
jgi:hypothetical protein